jgi:hypothetical protein
VTDDEHYARKAVIVTVALAAFAAHGLARGEYVLEPIATLAPVAAGFAVIVAARVIKKILEI